MMLDSNQPPVDKEFVVVAVRLLCFASSHEVLTEQASSIGGKMLQPLANRHAFEEHLRNS